MKKLTLFLVTFFSLGYLLAQQEEHAHWKLTSKKINACEYELTFTVNIDKGWHVYAVHMPSNEGPQATSLVFESGKSYTLIGKIIESTPIKKFDNVFGVDVAYHENSFTLKQRVQVLDTKKITITGNYEYQVCLEDKCLFVRPTPFEITLDGSEECLKAEKGKPSQTDVTTKTISASDSANNQVNDSSLLANIDAPTTSLPSNNEQLLSSDEASITGKTWWILFLTGLGWGFAAIFTPCVFPLIPMNVSFFLKRSGSQQKGRMDAMIYVFSIIAIFILLGLGISALWGGGALHTFSTSVAFNSIVFVLLLIFAASFLGAFEITLPSSFVNIIDKQSDRGGYMGIFFMALTLVVVSFSCTGPMVGNALVAASTSGNTSGAFWSMFGFSAGLALPFGFFAFFPSLLNNIPKSGGWLNSVKVVLGFLELALALKFASNIDLVYQTHILTREVFLTLWIVIFALTTLYLLGIFKTSHDTKVEHLSVIRLFFVIISFSVTVYLIPGLWGAPLKLFSGVLPPYDYSEAPQGFGNNQNNNSSINVDNEFSQHIHVNKNGIVHFKNNYTEALAYAKKTGKPLMVDFTGHACASCRKTEDYVWPDAEVTKRLNNNVVLVSLYVDDKRKLDEKDFMTVNWYGREEKITTIGDKFKYMQETRYKQSTQPLYILLDHNEQLLNQPRGYNPNIEEYIHWLDEGINAFEK
jgi:thiol:disulfide interchange protein